VAKVHTRFSDKQVPIPAHMCTGRQHRPNPPTQRTQHRRAHADFPLAADFSRFTIWLRICRLPYHHWHQRWRRSRVASVSRASGWAPKCWA